MLQWVFEGSLHALGHLFPPHISIVLKLKWCHSHFLLMRLVVGARLGQPQVPMIGMPRHLLP
jgi:hypothetical protein